MKVSTVNTSISARKLLIFFLLMLFLLFFCACNAEGEVEISTDSAAEGNMVQIDDYLLMREIDVLPAPLEDALFCVEPSPDSSSLIFVFEDGLTFYRQDALEQEGKYAYYEYQILPRLNDNNSKILYGVGTLTPSKFGLCVESFYGTTNQKVYLEQHFEIGNAGKMKCYYTVTPNLDIVSMQVSQRRSYQDIVNMRYPEPEEKTTPLTEAVTEVQTEIVTEEMTEPIPTESEYYDRVDIGSSSRDDLPSAESSVECSVTMTEITSLPAPPDDVMFCVYGVACPPAYLFYEPGTVFYRLDYSYSPETGEDQYWYYEYELHVPQYLTDICFLGGGMGGGSSEIMLALEAKNVETGRWEYYSMHFLLDDVYDKNIDCTCLTPISRNSLKWLEPWKFSYDVIRETFQRMRESALNKNK